MNELDQIQAWFEVDLIKTGVSKEQALIDIYTWYLKTFKFKSFAEFWEFKCTDYVKSFFASWQWIAEGELEANLIALENTARENLIEAGKIITIK